MRAYIWLFPLPTSLNSGKALEKKVRELLALTKYNFAELKLTVIADLVSFNKKRDREVSGITRRDMILQRSLDCERAKTADNELVKLTKLEEKFAEVYTLLRLPGKGGKFAQCWCHRTHSNLLIS